LDPRQPARTNDADVSASTSSWVRPRRASVDEYPASCVARTGETVVRSDLDADYRRSVDREPLQAGVRSFVASRGIGVSRGKPGDDAGQEMAGGIVRA
jgi:hypothetical protein